MCSNAFTRVTRRVPLVEQERLTLPNHLSSSPVLSSCYSILIFVQYFIDCCLSFFLLIIVFPVLRITDSDYPPHTHTPLPLRYLPTLLITSKHNLFNFFLNITTMTTHVLKWIKYSINRLVIFGYGVGLGL